MLRRLQCVAFVGVAEQRQHASVDVALQPVEAIVLRHRSQRATQRIFADNLGHAEQLGQHRIGPERGDVGVALVACERRQHPGADHVTDLRRVRTRIGRRTVRDRGLEPARDLQELGEIDELAERRQRARRIPFDLDRTGKSVERDRAVERRGLNRQLLTCRVKRQRQKIVCHSAEMTRFSVRWLSANCRT